MVETNKLLKVMGSAGLLIMCFFIGVAQGRKDNAIFHLLALLISILFLCYSSRSAGFCLLLYLIGINLSNSSIISRIVIFLYVAILPLYLQIPLFMRAEYSQGLIPLVKILLNEPYIIWNKFDYYNVLDNFIFSDFHITVLTSVLAKIDTSYMITSLNPLPGIMTDWYALVRGVHLYIPFTSIGEWMSYSLVVGAIFYVIVGYLFFYVEYVLSYSSIWLKLINLSLLMMYLLTSLQYTTRSSTRFLYYLLFINFGFYCCRKIMITFKYSRFNSCEFR